MRADLSSIVPFRPITEIRPVMQKPDGGGTCMTAALATLMHRDHDDVFDIYTYEDTRDARWFDALTEWCQGQGYDLHYLQPENTQTWPLPVDGYYIAVWSWDGIEGVHTVVYKNGSLVHDPSPGTPPRRARVQGYYVLEPLADREGVSR